MNHQPKGEMMDEGKKNGELPVTPMIYVPGNGTSQPIPMADGSIMWAEIRGGLTKREYFAAMAMQGFCSNIEVGNMESKRIAEFAVDQAGALLAELAKTEVGG